jgi:sec-independent protein translocase protein TatB
MFESVGWGEIVVIVLAGLFILGPERLPAAAAWLGQNVRKAKEFAADANEQIRKEVGPEFDELRKPLADLRAPLQELRSLRSPRTVVMKHLLAEPDPEPAPAAATPRPPSTVEPAEPVRPASSAAGSVAGPTFDDGR